MADATLATKYHEERSEQIVKVNWEKYLHDMYIILDAQQDVIWERYNHTQMHTM